jgi:hypothetical protein
MRFGRKLKTTYTRGWRSLQQNRARENPRRVIAGRDRKERLMEVKINREIRDYTESMFFGLSLRQFVFSLLAIFVAVGIYFILREPLGTEIVSWVCVLGAAPFAAMGFIKYNGLTAERYLWAWLRSAFIMPKKLMFRATNIYAEALKSIVEGGNRA